MMVFRAVLTHHRYINLQEEYIKDEQRYGYKMGTGCTVLTFL
jgi:hypothetical protein